MTRRSALQVLSAYYAATVAPQATLYFPPGQPKSLAFVLDHWTTVRVTYKGETVVIDPKEMFDAMKSGGVK